MANGVMEELKRVLDARDWKRLEEMLEETKKKARAASDECLWGRPLKEKGGG